MPKSEKPKHNKVNERRSFYKQLEYVEDVLFAAVIDAHKILPRYRDGNADCSRDCLTVLDRLKHEGFSFAAKILPNLWGGLATYLETGISSYPGFKLQKGCKYPAFLRRHFARIYKDPLSSSAVDSINMIYQLSVLFKKYKGPHRKSVLKRQFDDFYLVDKSLPDVIEEDIYIKKAQRVIYRIFKDFSIDDKRIQPRPGPGATNTPVQKHERFAPHMMYTCIDDVMPYQEFFYTTPWDVNYDTKTFLTLYNRRTSRPTSRFKFVEKQYDKARGICIEENEMMWAQQGIKNYMYNVLESHPLTRGLVNFSDQSINQQLALSSSFSMANATLDEKEASDRVARILVHVLWKLVPDMRDVLMALSTRSIQGPAEANFSMVNIKKFAPMGSALCFPVMSVVHFALLHAIADVHGSDAASADIKRNLYVYGDDIIVPTRIVDHVLDVFPRYGLKFNTDKSFWRSKFRESCGLHAYNGVDITPVFLKRLPKRNSRADALLSALAAESDLFEKGFKETAATIRRALVKHYGMLPYVSKRSRVVGFRRCASTCSSMFKLWASGRRWNRDLHCYEYRFRVTSPVNVVNSLSQYCGYFRKLLTNAMFAKKVSDSADDVKIVWQWVSESSVLTDVKDTKSN